MITNAHSALVLLNTKEILATALSLCVVIKQCNANGNRQGYFLMVLDFIPQTTERSSTI
jgi:hypothetical protein